MALSDVPPGTWILLSAYSVNAALALVFGARNRRRRKVLRRGVGVYLTTGRSTAAFRANPDRVRQAARKWRSKRQWQPAFQTPLKPFQAVCGCPSCGFVALHWIEQVNNRSNEILRKCIECKNTWRQVS